MSDSTKTNMVVGMFSGSYRIFMSNWFWTLKVHGISGEESTLIAQDCASDLGDAMSKDGSLAATVSKRNKDGESSFKFSGKSGAVVTHRAMSCVRFFQQLEVLEKEGICERNESARELLSKGLTEYLGEVGKRAKEKHNWISKEEYKALKEQKPVKEQLADIGLVQVGEVIEVEKE